MKRLFKKVLHSKEEQVSRNQVLTPKKLPDEDSSSRPRAHLKDDPSVTITDMPLFFKVTAIIGLLLAAANLALANHEEIKELIHYLLE